MELLTLLYIVEQVRRFEQLTAAVENNSERAERSTLNNKRTDGQLNNELKLTIKLHKSFISHCHIDTFVMLLLKKNPLYLF